MKTMKWLFALSLGISMSGAVMAQQVAETNSEVRGTVEQWAPGVLTMQVGGTSYTLAKDVQVIDSNAVLLTRNAVRAGLSVQLLLSQGVVSHVVINPGPGSTMDQPQR